MLAQAIRFGSTIPLNHGEKGARRLFYFGRAAGAADYYGERLRVYDRKGCHARLRTAIRRVVQAARSTFFCPVCQPKGKDQTKSGLKAFDGWGNGL